jgi:hypothetical protein
MTVKQGGRKEAIAVADVDQSFYTGNSGLLKG